MIFFRGVCVVLFAMTLQEVLTEKQKTYEITVKSLVSRILESMRGDIGDVAVNNMENMMMAGYGSYCRLDGGASSTGVPVDDIDRVCKEYLDCLKKFTKEDPACIEYEYDEIPERLYDSKDINDGATSLCNEKYSSTDDQCRNHVCQACDIDKITSLKSEITKVVSDEDTYSKAWYWRVPK